MLSVTPSILLGELAAQNTDCACPIPPLHATAQFPDTALFQRADELFIAVLEDEWTLYCNPLAGGAPALLAPDAQARLDRFAQPARLGDDADRLLAQARLIVPLGAPTRPEGESELLTAWVHVTNACNLECPYCYVRKSAAHMPLDVGRRAVDALISTALRRGFTALKLKYAGGEAALHYRMVRELHGYAAERAVAAGLGLDAVVLSNGTVIPADFADWLAASGVRLMLSVDGVGADHDAQRPYKGGGDGAFARIERNLRERLLPRGIRPDVCVTVTGRNAERAHCAVRWAIEHDLPFSINFYRESEASAKHRELRFEEGQIIAGIRAAYAVVAELLPVRPFLDGLLDRVQAEAHSHTCGVGRNYVVITHEGRTAQCQMELQAAAPFDPDSDLIALVAAGSIHNVAVDEKEGCRECRWRYRCAGGCPLITLRATGRTDVKSPNCAIYQTLMPEALLLEGRRILKQHHMRSAAPVG